MSSKKTKTGGNLEPMPFIRRFGNEDDEGDYDNHTKVKLECEEENESKRRGSSPSGKKSKHSKRSSRSRSRSGERKRKKKRSRSRSRDRDREYDEKERRSGSHRRSRTRSRERRRGDMRETDQSYTQNYSNENAAIANIPSADNGDADELTNNPMAAAIAAAALAAQRIRDRISGGGPAQPQAAAPTARGPSIADSILSKSESRPSDVEERERRRKSRWSSTKSFIPGMPTILPSNIDDNQRESYLLTMEIEEATRRLRAGDFVPPPDVERSPSPEPIYDANGKRLNTREVRKRQELEQRRHEKIQTLIKLNPEYKPPADYRPPNIRFNDRVWIPQEENPTINFVGLLIGPRGNTLKALEAETGAKIIIRGKGSIKEGKLGRREGPLPGENEPLHAYVTATDRDAVKRGCDKVREIINAALMIPDGQNELRKLQLRELAILNGTLRPEDLLSGARCGNCGSDQHKTWECMEAPNVTAQVMCAACGGYGHVTKDCKNPRPGFQFDGAGIDAEYSALMAELGERPQDAMQATAIGFTGQPRIPLGFAPPRPRFVMPSGTPIVRVNLAQQIAQQRTTTPTSYGSSFFPPPMDPAAHAAAAAAWAAYMGYPAPVPPPPGGTENDPDTSGSTGLAFMPPPPPPPPPVPAPKYEPDNE